jgi:murein L,D-transpeptidase YafK
MKMIMLAALLLGLSSPAAADEFLAEQKSHETVKAAYAEKETMLADSLSHAGLDLENLTILIVAYKLEKELNVYVKGKADSTYKKFFSYEICKSSGLPGPKRKQGDLQVPEGFYAINIFNPASSYFLSLGINYPNQSDSLKSTATNLGGDIYIHGECVTVGCLPMTTDKIKEIYVLALQAHANGQENIPVYIFPYKFTEPNLSSYMKQYSADAELLRFWETLRRGYDKFQSTRQELHVTVDKTGAYLIQ